MNKYLVLIETAGNQKYIFATNKLRENIGASELVYRAGTRWVLDAVKDVGGPDLLAENPSVLRDILLDHRKNGRTEDGASVEVLVASSGKALLMTNKRETAEEVIKQVTLTALKEAPGLDISGVIERFDWESDRLDDVSRKVHDHYEAVRLSRKGPMFRFQRLPFVAECVTSGLPASAIEKYGNDEELISRVSETKRSVREGGRERLEKILGEFRLAENLDEMEEADWLAVIHADGNGVGRIFSNFGEVGNCGSDEILKGAEESAFDGAIADFNRRYVDRMREFSISLDVNTERAFLGALETIKTKIKEEGSDSVEIPLVPLIIGGDDWTVVCDGKYAFGFTEAFLRLFEEETEKNITGSIAENDSGHSRLAACAGIAMIKPHFPFSAAYSLSEDLLKEAKKVKGIFRSGDKTVPASALSFHVLYGTSFINLNLNTIREKMQTPDKARTYGSPYLITDAEELTGVDGEAAIWAVNHNWDSIKEKVEVLRRSSEETTVPRSQLHHLLRGLSISSQEADARFRLIRHRYKGLDKLAGVAGGDSLFWSEGEGESDVMVTCLLDAKVATAFMPSIKVPAGGSV